MTTNVNFSLKKIKNLDNFEIMYYQWKDLGFLRRTEIKAFCKTIIGITAEICRIHRVFLK